MKNKIPSEFTRFDILLDVSNSKNATGGRFFVSFFFCQKNEH